MSYLSQTTINKLIYSKKSFLQLDKDINKLSKEKISNYKLFTLIHSYFPAKKFIDVSYSVYCGLELLKMVSNSDHRYSNMTHRFYPILRLAIMTKFYYWIMLYRYNLEGLLDK